MSKDPTSSITLRSEYEAQFYSRWEKCKSAVNTTLVEKDALNLNSSAELAEVPEPPTREDLKGQTPQEKKETFRQWLVASATAVFALESVPSPSIPNWQLGFALMAFIKGVRFARARLREAGYVVNEQLNNIDLRSFVRTQDPYRTEYENSRQDHVDALEKVIDDTVTEATREVGTGLAGKRDRREISEEVNDRIDKIGITNGRRLANSEVNRGFNHAVLTTYREHGVEQVGVEAEGVRYVTAEDEKVCPECKPYHGEIISIEKAWELLPLHSNCRCTVYPAAL